MELQDFAPLRFYTRLVFSEPQSFVLDQRGKTAHEMSKHLKLAGVIIHPTAAEVKSEDGRDGFRIGVAQTYALLGNFDRIEEATEQAQEFFEMALDHLGHPKVSGLNIHTVEVAPTDSFELVRDRLTDGLLSGGSAALGTAVGAPLSDVGWSADFVEPNRKISIRLGPMQSDQLGELLQEQDPDSPPNMVYLDVDSDSQIGERSSKDAIESWTQAVATHQAMTARINDWLRKVLS